jgi:hypothetical protein
MGAKMLKEVALQKTKPPVVADGLAVVVFGLQSNKT